MGSGRGRLLFPSRFAVSAPKARARFAAGWGCGGVSLSSPVRSIVTIAEADADNEEDDDEDALSDDVAALGCVCWAGRSSSGNV